MTRIVPTTVLTVAALALVAPAAQAKPFIAPSGGPNDVSPIVQSIQAANAEKQAGVVHDTPLANPVELPKNLTAGLLHARLMPGAAQQIQTTTPVTVPGTSGDGIDWTVAGIGTGLVGALMLTIAAGFGVRRRGQLAV